jgi:hypothetical protein
VAMPVSLTQDQIEFFVTNGYLVLPKYWDIETVTNLRSRIAEIVKGYGDLKSKEAAVFTTKEQSRNDDDYFLNSGGNISFFWEENAKNDGRSLLFDLSRYADFIGT